jgi:hypothetical protein
MENIDGNAIQMELKYCERCGGLWLRIRGSEVVYCPGCSMILAGIARDSRGLEHSRIGMGAPDESQFDNTFWGEGGQA